ncbi:FAD/NAD(P)-binding protein [Bradyrhizobium oligotrophicum]|uniref:FAD/NAD(P)-binding protein n=1 Tax=Bradyrhizobium oligotrophicum TaxID=44255 RepID=UPI003EBDE7C4
MTRRHAIVIGGGASGALAAFHLLSRPDPLYTVTLIERWHEFGRGLAYRTTSPDHLLNVRAGNMSARPDDPDDFIRWLGTSVSPHAADPYSFVPRRIFGDYIASLIAPFAEASAPSGLTLLTGECVAISEGPDGVLVRLADGNSLHSDVLVLATGNDSRQAPFAYYANPWSPQIDDGLAKDAPLLILGAGLTMIDFVLSRVRAGHRGRIIALSCRGLMSHAHRQVAPLEIDERDVPFGASARVLLRLLRTRAEAHVAMGGDWRSVVDGIRPFTQRLWQQLPPASRRQFLEHGRAWWEIHRHRMAPAVEAMLGDVIASGQLTVIAGKVVDTATVRNGARVTYRPRGQSNHETIDVAAVVDCTGIVLDPGATANPALRSLFAQGLAQVDPLRIGLQADGDCALIGSSGAPSRRLFAVGPLTRPAFWEIIAIPDIRNQCAALAQRLTRDPP